MHRLFRLFLVLLLLAAGPILSPVQAPVWAQSPLGGTDTGQIDYQTWESIARLAEKTLEEARASNDALEALRGRIVEWRERFLAGQSVNAARIETLQEQIAALGPVPAEGTVEAEEIAARRGDLNAQLAEAQSPVRRAEEAFRRAEGIVRQIDALIRLRQADELLSLGPSPANPAIWPAALAEFADSVMTVYNEIRTNLSSEATRQALIQKSPRTLLYLLIAGVLLLRGRRTMVLLTGMVMNRSRGRARWLAAFLTSLFQVAVPLVGLVLLVEALQSTGLLGLHGETLLEAMPEFGLYVLAARWVGLRLYPLHEDVPRPMPSSWQFARGMRLYITLMGLLLGLMELLNTLIAFEKYPPESVAVLYLPLIGLMGLLFLRIGQILAMAIDRVDETPGLDLSFAQRGQRIIGKLLLFIGIAAPVAALIGYQSLAYQMISPTAVSLALLGVLRVLHDIVVEIHAVLTRKTHEEARQALIPSLVSFGLVLASVPLFALIWGARVADLTEIWVNFQEGFTVGEAQISPMTLFTFLVVFGLLYGATRLFQGALKSTILPKTKIDPGGQNAIVSGIGYLGIGLGVLVSVTTAGIDLSALAFVAGALSVGIGFGLQNIVSNFISGIILLVERPVAEGDWIEVGGHMGIVKTISVRSTTIETFDKNNVIVPNADFISGSVKNWTRGNVNGRIVIPVGVAYGSDTRKVQDILLEIISNHPLVALDPAPGVDFLEFGASSLDFQIRAILPDIGHGLAVKTEVRHQIAERFAQEGIEIPFAQTDIWIRNADALRPPAPAVSLDKAPEIDLDPEPADPPQDEAEGEGEH